jgi:membrane protein
MKINKEQLQAINHRTFRIPAILYTAGHDFVRLRTSEAAASLAYYAIFSLFPLLILLIAILSFGLKESQVQTQIVSYLQRIFPASDLFVGEIIDQNLTDLIELNIRHLVEVRGTAGILGAIGLLWASSNFFTALARNINRAWHITAAPLSFLHGRLLAFIMISILAILLLISLVCSTVLTIANSFQAPIWGERTVAVSNLWELIVRLTPYLISFILFFCLYYFVPNARVRGVEAFWGALAVTLVWRLAVVGFAWIFNQGFVNYQLFYGSLAALVSGIIWIYIGSLIILFGAHLSAAIAVQTRLQQKEAVTEQPSEATDSSR